MKPLSFFRSATTALMLVLSIGASSCALDFANPNAAAEGQVLTTRDGLFTLAVGMQQFYATSTIEAYVTRSAVTSREMGVTTTFQNPLDLELGGAGFPAENGDVLAVWSRSYRVIGMADNIIANAPNVTMPDSSRSGLIALAQLYKAMCLGHLVMYFEQAPLSVGTVAAPATFRSRADVLTEAVRLLDDAAQRLRTTPPNTLFTSSVPARGLNLANTIQAMRARFLNMAGRHADAIAAANAVVTTPAGVSLFTYDAQNNRNPFFLSIIQGNTYAPRDFFGTPVFTAADSADGRWRFFMRANARVGTAPAAYAVDDLVAPFFATADVATPIFRMGEMALIRAEAQARQNNLTAAVTEINAIRTKSRMADPHGIGAGLTAYSGAVTQEAILTEIYKQRCVELFLTGQRMEDQRRFGRQLPPVAPNPDAAPNTASFRYERNRVYYPYPTLEKDNNTNTPANPPI